MFPDLTQLRRAIAARVSDLAATLPARVAVASLLVCLHLTVFARASHSRLGLPFDTSPTEAPYFSDPDASTLRSSPRQPHHWDRLAVSRFDAQHFIATAERGLTACPHAATDDQYLDCGLGWLPAWGLVGGVVSSVAPLASDSALLLLAIIAAIAINVLWTGPVIAKRFGRGAAWGAMIGFNAFPAAFYLVTPYSEGATLVLGLAGFVALAKERWWLAAGLVGASTALQPSSMVFAIALACALGVAAYRRRPNPGWWKPLIAVPLCAWGQLVTLIGLQISVGDWSAYLRARHAFGATYHWRRLVDVEYYMKGLAGQDMDGAMLLATAAIVALTAREVVKRLEIPEATYVIVASLGAFVLAVVTPPHYWGQTQLLLSCLMMFFGLGVLAKKHPIVFVLWCVLGLAFYWHVDLCGYVAQGDIGKCPSLGRIELAIPVGS
ncbi:MAG: hypothetical protein ABJE66_29645 [Deltaproteobacteria bacterium]